MKPKLGSIAFCKRGALGLITNGPDAGGTWHGIHLTSTLSRLGSPWQAKEPAVVGHVDAYKREFVGTMLKDLLDWPAILAEPRYAGGHEEVLNVLFAGATVIASWRQDDWQGSLAWAYRLADGRYVCLTDGFGSCSGCDSWDGSSDDEARAMCVELANNAHAFATLDDMILFIVGEVPSDQAAYWHEQHLDNLLPDLKRLQQIARIGGPNTHPDSTP